MNNIEKAIAFSNGEWRTTKELAEQVEFFGAVRHIYPRSTQRETTGAALHAYTSAMR